MSILIHILAGIALFVVLAIFVAAALAPLVTRP